MLPDLVVKLAMRGSLTVKIAAAALETVRSRYRDGVIEHSLAQLEMEEKHGESCGAG